MTMERFGIIHGPGRPTICLGLAHGDWVTICSTAPDRTGDFEGQTREILSLFDGYLADAGSDKSQLLTAHIWLKNMSDYDAVNEIWNSWIDPDNPPTRSCVTANMADPRSLIEIRITAARDIG